METIERIVYESDVAAIGTYRCPRHHRRFRGGTTETGLAVFPRTAVVIERERAEPVLADPNTVVFYNPGDEYRRREIDRRGDHCDFFALPTELVEEIAARCGGMGARYGLVGVTHGPAAASLYLSQRRLVSALVEGAIPDPLLVDELAVRIFAGALGDAHAVAGRPSQHRSGTQQRHTNLVRRAKHVMTERATSRLSLSAIAREVAVSPYHLARIFRIHTGFTVHGYVTQLRLRRALDHLEAHDSDLSMLALDLGFASHSHFTRTFRSVFGCTPSEVRREAGRAADDLRKIVTV